MGFKWIFTVILLMATLLFGTVPSHSGQDTARSNIKIDIAKFNYRPLEIRVHEGDSVIRTSRDLFVHTVTSGTVVRGRRNTTKQPDGIFDSGDIKGGRVLQDDVQQEGRLPLLL